MWKSVDCAPLRRKVRQHELGSVDCPPFWRKLDKLIDASSLISYSRRCKSVDVGRLFTSLLRKVRQHELSSVYLFNSRDKVGKLTEASSLKSQCRDEKCMERGRMFTTHDKGKATRTLLGRLVTSNVAQHGLSSVACLSKPIEASSLFKCSQSLKVFAP